MLHTAITVRSASSPHANVRVGCLHLKSVDTNSPATCHRPFGVILCTAKGPSGATADSGASEGRATCGGLAFGVSGELKEGLQRHTKQSSLSLSLRCSIRGATSVHLVLLMQCSDQQVLFVEGSPTAGMAHPRCLTVQTDLSSDDCCRDSAAVPSSTKQWQMPPTIKVLTNDIVLQFHWV